MQLATPYCIYRGAGLTIADTDATTISPNSLPCIQVSPSFAPSLLPLSVRHRHLPWGGCKGRDASLRKKTWQGHFLSGSSNEASKMAPKLQLLLLLLLHTEKRRIVLCLFGTSLALQTPSLGCRYQCTDTCSAIICPRPSCLLPTFTLETRLRA